MTKTCTACGESKPLDEFHVRRAGSDGHDARCKPCKCEQQAVIYDGLSGLAYSRRLLNWRRGAALKRIRDRTNKED